MTTMDGIDEMLQAATTTSPDEAAQLQDLEGDGGDLSLKVEAVQVSPESRLVTIYHTQTGSPRRLPKLYARTALLKRFRLKDGAELAGRFVFVSKDPGIWKLGSVKCLLHPDRPERALYDALGYPICKSKHFPSEYEASRHLENDHNATFERIADIKQQEERDEDRQLQLDALRSNQELVRAVTGNGAATAVAETPAKAPRRRRNGGKSFTCANGCGKTIKNQKMHNRNSHPEA